MVPLETAVDGGAIGVEFRTAVVAAGDVAEEGAALHRQNTSVENVSTACRVPLKLAVVGEDRAERVHVARTVRRDGTLPGRRVGTEGAIGEGQDGIAAGAAQIRREHAAARGGIGDERAADEVVGRPDVGVAEPDATVCALRCGVAGEGATYGEDAAAGSRTCQIILEHAFLQNHAARAIRGMVSSAQGNGVAAAKRAIAECDVADRTIRHDAAGIPPRTVLKHAVIDSIARSGVKRPAALV